MEKEKKKIEKSTDVVSDLGPGSDPWQIFPPHVLSFIWGKKILLLNTHIYTYKKEKKSQEKWQHLIWSSCNTVCLDPQFVQVWEAKFSSCFYFCFGQASDRDSDLILSCISEGRQQQEGAGHWEKDLQWHLPPWPGLGRHSSRVRKAPTTAECRALIFLVLKV